MCEADFHCSYAFLRRPKKLHAMADYPMDYHEDDLESFHFDGGLDTNE